MAVNIGIIGASGYTGAELIRLAATHTEMEITYVTANQYRGIRVDELYPHLTGITDLAYEAFDFKNAVAKAQFFFLGLPHGQAMKVVSMLLDAGHQVIDLSGDFRLNDAATYEAWYKTKHANPELMLRVAYGLPELFEEKIRESAFTSNPGCYPTGAILALAPLLANKLVKLENLIINSLSGVSGAGREPKPETHFCKIDESLTAYKVGGIHQHTPEIEQYLSEVAGEELALSFTPHLVPVNRGILTTAYANSIGKVDLDKVIETYNEFYKDKPFVHVLPKGKYPETKNVIGSNFCHIGLAYDDRTGRIIAISAIDNLVKGASGQAIQNMNIMLGFPQDMGLKGIGLVP